MHRTLDTLEDLGCIAETLQDEPPFSVREGEFIRDGFTRRWIGSGASYTAAGSHGLHGGGGKGKKPASVP